MSWEILAPLIGVAGIWLGSFLQKNRERHKDRQDRRLESYAKFLEIWAVSERFDFGHVMQRWLSQQQLSEQEAHFITFVKERFDHAHANLMIYGSEQVITALSELYQIIDAELTDHRKDAYTGLLSAMRADGFSKNYEKFRSDVDNIMLSGPIERREVLFQRHSPSKSEGE